MLDRPLVAFDIETIPDPDIGRRVHGLEGSDAEVVRLLVDRRREETNGSSDYPQPPHHAIACVCATIVHPTEARVEVRRLGDDAGGERGAIQAFYGLVGEELDAPRIVSWNGGGFDLPILRYRAMRHGVAAPGFHRHDGDLRSDGYLARYGTMHVDLMDVLASHGASSRAGLGTISRLLELPGKSFLERAVWEHWIEGERARVVEYCKLDTVETMLVYLAWSLHTGHATRAEVDAIAGATRAAIAREPFEGWRAIGESLEGWPHWPR